MEIDVRPIPQAVQSTAYRLRIGVVAGEGRNRDISFAGCFCRGEQKFSVPACRIKNTDRGYRSKRFECLVRQEEGEFGRRIDGAG